MTRKHNLFLGAFLSALLLFTVYVLLDTFVIERRIEAAAETQPIGSQPADDAAESAGETGGISLLSSPQTEDGSAERVTTENCYQDGNVSVQITEELRMCSLHRRHIYKPPSRTTPTGGM